MSASSSSTSVGLCLVCDKPGTHFCGGCKRTRFCSSSCQRVVWPVHKVSCRRSGDQLYLPPLKPDELAEVERRKNERLFKGNTLAQGLYATWPAVSWEDFMTLLSSTDATDNVRRNEVIMWAHLHLVIVSADQQAARAASAWRDFGSTAYKMIVTCYADDESQPPPHWLGGEGSLRLDGVLRRQLVMAAVMRACRDDKFEISWTEAKRLVTSCARRTVEEIERADLPQSAKRLLKPQAQVRLEYRQIGP